jgi:NCAIR mutase (PurE)-related protein
MTPQALLAILSEVEQGRIAPADAVAELARLPFEDLGHSRVDHHRSLRTGLPEVIYAGGKTPGQTVAIFSSLRRDGVDALATRVSAETASALLEAHPDAAYNPVARTVSYRQPTSQKRDVGYPAETHCGHIAVVCAGTSDLPVAEEAAVTSETFGARVTRLYDVGVAGLHRILAVRETLAEADAVIVCAGMEGALPSVVGGLVGVPVIAVPTSVGYGASFGGASALLGMLNSCSPNVVVVNIDNGFGAAYSAVLIARGATRTGKL